MEKALKMKASKEERGKMGRQSSKQKSFKESAKRLSVKTKQTKHNPLGLQLSEIGGTSAHL
jgi:hypothetical protein